MGATGSITPPSVGIGSGVGVGVELEAGTGELKLGFSK